MTVWALPSNDLHTNAVRSPRAWASMAARMPAPPAPMMTTSKSWDSYSAMCPSVLEVESVVVDGPARHQAHVEVGEGHPGEAHPGDEHVARVEWGEGLPQPVADGSSGELLDPAAAQVTTGVAAERVRPQQGGVDAEDDRADADADPDPRLAEGQHRVDGENHVEDEPQVEEATVDVLEQEWEPGLTG